MKIWKRRAAGQETAAGPVQLRGSEWHPFALLDGYVPLHEPAFGLYRAIREAVPVVDAAVLKLVRLAGGVRVSCADKGLEKRLAEFLRTVPVGWNQVGLQAFLDSYLDCLLTCGKRRGGGAVRECVRCADPGGGGPVVLQAGAKRSGWVDDGAAPAGAAALYAVSPGRGAPLWGVAAAQLTLSVRGAVKDLADLGGQLGAGGERQVCGGL